MLKLKYFSFLRHIKCNINISLGVVVLENTIRFKAALCPRTNIGEATGTFDRVNVAASLRKIVWELFFRTGTLATQARVNATYLFSGFCSHGWQ